MHALVVEWLWSVWAILCTVGPDYLYQLFFLTNGSEVIQLAMVSSYDVARRLLGDRVQAWTPTPETLSRLLRRSWPWLQGLYDRRTAVVAWLTAWLSIAVASVAAGIDIVTPWIAAGSAVVANATWPLVEIAVMHGSVVAVSVVEWAAAVLQDLRVVFRWAFGEDPWPLGHLRAVARAARPWFAIVAIITVAAPHAAPPVSAGCVRSGETMVCGGGLCDPMPARNLERLLLNGDAHAPTPEAVLDNYPNIKVRDNPFSIACIDRFHNVPVGIIICL